MWRSQAPAAGNHLCIVVPRRDRSSFVGNRNNKQMTAFQMAEGTRLSKVLPYLGLGRPQGEVDACWVGAHHRSDWVGVGGDHRRGVHLRHGLRIRSKFENIALK